MISKIIYVISLISLVFLTILTVEMLPLIFQAKWQGMVYLVCVIFMLVLELYTLFNNKQVLKKSISYNIFIILITMYVGIIYYKIFSINTNSLFIYDIDISYCRENYLILSIALILIIINLVSSVREVKKKKIV